MVLLAKFSLIITVTISMSYIEYENNGIELVVNKKFC